MPRTLNGRSPGEVLGEAGPDLLLAEPEHRRVVVVEECRIDGRPTSRAAPSSVAAIKGVQRISPRGVPPSRHHDAQQERPGPKRPGTGYRLPTDAPTRRSNPRPNC